MRLPWYFEAVLVRHGEEIACWTSEIPGKTGPDKTWWRWPLMALRGWRVRLRTRGVAR